MDLLTLKNTRLLNDAVANARIKKMQEKEALENNKIGNAEFTVVNTFKKEDPRNNRDTLFIHDESLQASNEVFGETIGNPIKVAGGVKLNVKSSSAMVRTDSNGDLNPNAAGLVVKINAQNEKGVFIREEGYFQDTDEHLAIFEAANNRAIDHIVDLLFAEDSPYKKISMVSGLAIENAALPERFADKLADMLFEKLGISTQKVKNGKGFGLKVMKLGKPKTERKSTKKNAKDTVVDSATEKADDVIKSFLSSRPQLESIVVDPEDRSLLSTMYPDIEQRMARVAFISESFSRKLTEYINYWKQLYEKKGDDRDETEDFYYEGLTRGTEEQQRLFALKEIRIEEGMPLGGSILNEIKKGLAAIADFGSSDESITQFVNDYLLNKKDNIFGKDFAEELESMGIEPGSQKATRYAFMRARYLAEESAKMISTDELFNALCRDAAIELEFSENIRFDFESLPVEKVEKRPEDFEDDDNFREIENEDGENANKEGYMIKYKLLDPAKSMTTRIKKLLGSLYKRNNKNSTLFVFNDLGGRVRMDPLVAYRILLDEFSDMKNEESFASTLDRAIEKYPWLGALRDILVFNPLNPKAFGGTDLRNEFYSIMRKAEVPYGMISNRGLVKRLNRSNSKEDILANIKKNYEGHNVLGPNSIYTDTGEANVDNCKLIYGLFEASTTKADERITGSSKEDREKKRWAVYSRQPLGWALKALTNYRTGNGNVKDIIEALKVLAGMSDHHKKVRLETMLKNVGVDTSKIDVDSMFGDIPFLEEEELEDIKTLDDIAEYISPEQVTRLIAILNSIKIIVNQSSAYRYAPGVHLITQFQGAYLAIGNALSLAADGYTAMTFRHMDSSRATYAAPDFISDLVGIISNMESREEADRWIEQNYGQYDFFRKPSTGEWLNSWLENFFYQDSDGNYPFRENFEYINILSVLGSNPEKDSVSNVSKDNLKMGLVHAFFAANGAVSDNIKFAYYRTPLISDVDALVLIKGPRYTGEGYKDEIVKRLVKVLRQEVDRITATLESSKDPNSVKVEFFNSSRLNGLKFMYFPELESRKAEILEICTQKPGESNVKYVERRDRELAEIISNHIAEKAAKFVSSFSERDKLAFRSRNKSNAAQNERLKEEEEKKIVLYDDEEEANNEDTSIKAKEKAFDLAKADEELTEFFYNDYFAQSQIQQLMGGDLAFYKNYTDYVKRNKQAYACGDRLFARKTDEQGNILGPLTETVMYMEDEDVMSNTYEKLKDLMEEANMTDVDRSIMKFTLESFRQITSTDGQSFRTIDSFRKIFKARGGKWTEDMERAYQNIKEGRITGKDFLSLWNPIKPFFYGHETIKIKGRNEKVVTQHKNSEYMITAFYSWLNTALNKSPKLVGLHKFMIDHNVDVVHFHSVVKEGFNSPFSLQYNKAKFDLFLKKGRIQINGKPFKGTSYEDYMNELGDALAEGLITQEEYNAGRQEFDFKSASEVQRALEAQCTNPDGSRKEIMFKDFPMDSYMIVQPSDDHLIDAEAIFGTQIKNIIMADLPDDFSITINIDGGEKKLDKDEAVRFFNSLLVDNMLDAFSQISDEFSDIESLQEALFAKMKGNPKYGDDVKAALQINKTGDGFMLPFNSPTLSNKIEELILSTFKNAIQRQKIKGGNAVLVSNFGLHDDLHVVYKDKNDHSKGVEYIEAYLPATSKAMYEDFLVQKGEYQEIDFEKMKATLGKSKALELLDIIGYRIPTEDKYSIMPIRIKGFMPISAGSTIMLPADIITMSGTDFDIDKLFIMMKEFEIVDYPPSLSYEFKKWLEKNKEQEAEADAMLKGIFGDSTETSEALEEGNAFYDSLRNLLRRKKQGYSIREIDRLVDKNETFARFMEERGYDMQYAEPRYKILRPETTVDGKEMSLDDISRQSQVKSRSRRTAIRNNMLIDVMRQTLAYPEVSKLLMQPGNFDRVKHGSRQQKIMHNPVALTKFRTEYKEEIDKYGLFTILQKPTKSMIEKFIESTKSESDKKKLREMLKKPSEGLSVQDSISFLDMFYEENAVPVDPLSIIDYVDMHRNLMDGNALIGMFAVNSSNHYKLQFTPLDIDEDYQLTINGIKVTKIDIVYSSFTGERIGRINAEFQAASPDNGKDPCLGDVGANTKTAKVIGFLSRIGLSPEMTGFLNTCDDFTEYAKGVHKELKDSKVTIPPIKDFNMDMNKLALMMSIFRTNSELFNKEMENPESKMFVAQFYVFMKTIDKLSKTLGKVSKVSRSDSVNGALPVNLPEAIQQYMGAIDFIEDVTYKSEGKRKQKGPIKGLGRLVDIGIDAMEEGMTIEEIRRRIMESPVPRLQAAYTLGIKSALSMCGDMFPALSDGAMNAILFFRSQIQKNLTSKEDAKLVRKFLGDLTMAMLSVDSEFATNDRGTIMDKRNYYIHDFPMKFKKFKEAKDENGELLYPEVVKLNIIQNITNIDGKGLKFRNVGGTSERDRKHFVEELESLLWSDREEVRNFAQDLFMYSYFDNGFQFSHNNFGIFFTTTYLKNMPKFIQSLNNGNARLYNGEFDYINFVCQFILNNYALVPALKGKLYTMNGNRLIPTEDGILELAAGSNKTGAPVMFIQAKGKLWKANGTGKNIYYTEIDFNKTETPYYDMSMDFTEIDYGSLKKRGHIGKVPTEKDIEKLEKKAKGKDNDEGPDVKEI